MEQMGSDAGTVTEDMSRNQRRAAQRAPVKTGIASQLSSIVEIAKSLPHTIQATLSSQIGDSLWSVLELPNFIGSPEALTLKHGAYIDGNWSIIALLDARPDAGAQLNPFENATGNVADMMRGLQEFIRQQFGRPQTAYAVTPLAYIVQSLATVRDDSREPRPRSRAMRALRAPSRHAH